MTEKNEKAARNELEKEHDVLAAAEIMAQKLEQPKAASNYRAYFYD